jgi:hypothetical protein
MVSWKYQDKIISSIEEVPEGVYGFLYIITDINGYWYIGRKALYSTVTRKPLKGTKKKRKVTKESNWMQYSSSNKYFKQLESWEIVDRTIIDFAYSRKELTFLETEALFTLQALRNPMSKNGNILGKFYPGDITGNKKE